MTMKEFESAMSPMLQALGVKMNKYQKALYYEEFGGRLYKDFQAACKFCGMGRAGYLPNVSVLKDSVSAATEMRQEAERIEREKEMDQVHRIHFTPQERLEANRAAFEFMQQVGQCRRSGQNCYDREKVRLASSDPSKDQEIQERYGEAGPSMREALRGR